MPTATEFQWIKKKYRDDVAKEIMIDFAKLHVEAALKAAWENWEFEEGCDTHGVSLKEESIINAYPKENII